MTVRTHPEDHHLALALLRHNGERLCVPRGELWAQPLMFEIDKESDVQSREDD